MVLFEEVSSVLLVDPDRANITGQIMREKLDLTRARRQVIGKSERYLRKTKAVWNRADVLSGNVMNAAVSVS